MLKTHIHTGFLRISSCLITPNSLLVLALAILPFGVKQNILRITLGSPSDHLRIKLGNTRVKSEDNLELFLDQSLGRVRLMPDWCKETA
ncbi:hypothetical protein [Echinicola sp. 20G]|uniref:hypothetical protein n=1 Tax=Echinicola sp. 20G TaxID=2781961 RepID=UPI00190FC593|nr:hypothetical protein [Echinicola sp. 20G]